MLSQIESGSEAMRDGADGMCGCLIPAMCGCVQCGTVRMISAPIIGACEGCGSELTILDGRDVLARHHGAPTDGGTRGAA